MSRAGARLIMLLAFTPVPVAATSQSTTRDSLSRDLVDAMQSVVHIQQGLYGFTDLLDTTNTKFQVLRTATGQFAEKYLPPELLVPLLADFYSRTFTEQELRGLIRFCRSPA
jgi:hypothetical protein